MERVAYQMQIIEAAIKIYRFVLRQFEVIVPDLLAFAARMIEIPKVSTAFRALLTIVCCIEAGRLEGQTLRMIGSLRKFGGPMADIRVLAVLGRNGPPLRSTTIEKLNELGAELVRAQASDNPATWFGYANKAAAVATAQRVATSDVIAWIDSDVLFASPPFGLLLDPEIDFAARSEFLPPAIRPDDPTNVGYWSEVLDLFGLDVREVPWIDRHDGRPPQKIFFNSGIFAWRKQSGFAAGYVSAFNTLLKSRLAQRDRVFHFVDQVILTPVLLKFGLRWLHLGQNEHFMIFDGFIDGDDAAPAMNGAQIVHYSKSLDEPFRPRFLKRVKAELPHVYSYVMSTDQQDLGQGHLTPIVRAVRVWRGLRWRIHSRRVRPCMDDGTQFSLPEHVLP